MKILIMLTLFILQIFFCHFALAQTERGVGNIRSERKIALIIGNTNYDASVGRLKNPINDAKDVATALRRLDFTLVGGGAQLDVNKKQMLELVREFGKQIKQGGIGFFYFSGHGVQVNKENYVIPITDALVYEDDAEAEAVKVDAVAKEMELAGNRLNILVLDACRNNNLAKRSRNSEGGLTEPKRKPKGTFIAFAADDGQTASDNVAGRNGLFTQEFLKNLETPNARLDDVFRVTRNAVETLSDGRQQPMFFDKTNEAVTLSSSGSAVAQTQPDNYSNPPRRRSEDLSVKEETIYYEAFDLVLGSGEQEFVTKWSSCSNDCIYAYSDKLDGIANSRVDDFDEVGDFTSYDRSSRARRIGLNQILVLRNSAGYYALVQIAKISKNNARLTVRYKIIPEKRQSAWKPNPNKYVSRNSTGRVKFAYEDNDKNFIIGQGREKFDLEFGRLGKERVRLYNDDGISLISVTGGGTIESKGRIAELNIGDSVTIANKNGVRAVVKIIDAKTSGYSADIDEVEFEYQILAAN